MPGNGVILYGPPAAGKDTITAALIRLHPDYVHFPRLKAGTGRTDGYRLTTLIELDQLRDAGQIVYENHRYGNRYAVDRPHLDTLTAADLIPVVHIGQVAGAHAVLKYPARWLPVLLWCSRQATEKRVTARGNPDIAARLRAWDETQADLSEGRSAVFRLSIDTEHHDPESAAQLIHATLIDTDPTAPSARDG